MERKKFNAFSLLYIIPASICFFLAFDFGICFSGHGVLAMFFLGLGAVIVFYRLVSLLARRYKNLARIIGTAATGLLLLGAVAFTLAEIEVAGAAKTDSAPGADYLIVLGAGVNGTVPSLSLRDRLDAALTYLNKNPETIAVVSGGQGPGEHITEAQAMFDFLVDSGIDQERIIREEESESTEENITFSIKKIKQAGGSDTATIAIVTSEYHLYRAKRIAGRQGIDPVGVAAETSMPTLKLNHFLREALGVILMFFGID